MGRPLLVGRQRVQRRCHSARARVRAERVEHGVGQRLIAASRVDHQPLDRAIGIPACRADRRRIWTFAAFVGGGDHGAKRRAALRGQRRPRRTGTKHATRGRREQRACQSWRPPGDGIQHGGAGGRREAAQRRRQHGEASHGICRQPTTPQRSAQFDAERHMTDAIARGGEVAGFRGRSLGDAILPGDRVPHAQARGAALPRIAAQRVDPAAGRGSADRVRVRERLVVARRGNHAAPIARDDARRQCRHFLQDLSGRRRIGGTGALPDGGSRSTPAVGRRRLHRFRARSIRHFSAAERFAAAELNRGEIRLV